MKVKDLVTRLSEQDPDATVVIPVHDDLRWELDYGEVSEVEVRTEIKYAVYPREVHDELQVKIGNAVLIY